jgi:hypothetical protein
VQAEAGPEVLKMIEIEGAQLVLMGICVMMEAVAGVQVRVLGVIKGTRHLPMEVICLIKMVRAHFLSSMKVMITTYLPSEMIKHDKADGNTPV